MPRIATTAKRVSVSLRDTDLKRLDEVSDASHLNPNDAIRKAIATEAFVQRTLASGGKILVRDEDGNVREVEFVS